MKKHRLIKLLENSPADLVSLHTCKTDALMQGIREYKNTGCISVSEAIAIYGRRFKHIQDNGYQIIGFPELMTELLDTTDKQLIVHIFSGQNFNYYVFTDRAVSRLIGILQFENNTSVV